MSPVRSVRRSQDTRSQGSASAFRFGAAVLGNLVLLAVLIWWRAPRRAKETLPAERIVSAMMAGVRYVRYSREMDATVIRGAAFFLFASAYLALLPLVARAQIGDGPEVYGELMAAVGVGSIVATFALNWLKARFGPNGLAALGTIGIAASLFVFAAAHDSATALAASFVAGAAWILALTTFFVSAQVSLPEWVRGRGLAIFLTVYFGALTVGSALWGEVASQKGVPFALVAAGVGALLAMALTWRWKLQAGTSLDLAPSMRWRSPSFLNRVPNDQGPILAIAEYRIDPKDSAAFLAVMHDISFERRRDGACAWSIYEDPDVAGKADRNLPHPFRAGTQISPVAGNGGRSDHGGRSRAVSDDARGDPLSRRAATPASKVEKAHRRRLGAQTGAPRRERRRIDLDQRHRGRRFSTTAAEGQGDAASPPVIAELGHLAAGTGAGSRARSLSRALSRVMRS